MSERWPFCFDADDVEITEDPPNGVVVTHQPTGTAVLMNILSTRDANIAAGLTRLDRIMRTSRRNDVTR